MYLAAAAFAANSLSSARDFASALTDGGVVLASGVVAGSVVILQAVLLFPIHRPRETDLSHATRFLHCVAVGLTMALLAWLAMGPLAYVLEQVHRAEWFSAFLGRTAAAPIPLGVFGITVVLMWHYGRTGIPVVVSILIAAAGAAAMLAGLAALLWSIPRLVEAPPGTSKNPYEQAMLGSAAVAALVGWGAGTPLILSFVRKRGHECALARVSAWIFLGTTVEAAAAIPLDVMVRKKTDCYCGESTFWTLTLCWAAGALALGPVVFLVPFSRRRKRWYAGLCDVCGYDMSGSMNAERCPECGTGWRVRAGSAEGPTAGC
jgi:hypothetical protein